MFDWLRKNVGRLVRQDGGSGGVGVEVGLEKIGDRFVLVFGDGLDF